MTVDRRRKQQLRALGSKYTEQQRIEQRRNYTGLRELGVRDARTRQMLAEVRAEGLDDAPPTWDAHCARLECAAIARWEQRRAGRDVRAWTVQIEVRGLGADTRDAARHLTGGARTPIFREPGLGRDRAVWFEQACGPVVRIDPRALDPLEYESLLLDYDPAQQRRQLPGPGRGEPGGLRIKALERAALRAREPAIAARLERGWIAERTAVRQASGLPAFAARFALEYLAPCYRDAALARARELAATVVDFAGRPVGIVLKDSLAANDGSRHPLDGLWVHPAIGYVRPSAPRLFHQMWDDHDAAADNVGDRRALAELFDRELARCSPDD